MTKSIKHLVTRLSSRAGVSKDVIEEIQTQLGISFPSEYVQFISQYNGTEGVVGESYLAIWPVEDIAQLNEAYAVNEFVPGLLLFGSNGGGMAYAFDTRSQDMPIVEVPFIPMDLKEANVCGRTFLEFLEYLYSQT
ncbi:MAG: SMI1/KNR4 family protein [Chloroflexi bacterium]|nr:SMI1/KNR4 family protein [Chloroflexota bacterium]